MANTIDRKTGGRESKPLAISKLDGAEFLADIKPQCGERGKV